MTERMYHVFRGNQYLGQMSETAITDPSFCKPGDMAGQVNVWWAVFLFQEGRWKAVSRCSFPKEIQAWLLLLT